MHAPSKSFAILAVVASASATSFKLKVHVTDFDLTPSIEGEEVSVEPDPALSSPTRPIASTRTPRGQPLTFTNGGTAAVPSLNVVTFSDEPRTHSLGVAFDENTALTSEGGVFTVCPASRLNKDGEHNLVSFKSTGQRTIYGCANVELQEATA